MRRFETQLSKVDDALNVLDNVRTQLPQRVASVEKAADGSALASRMRALTDHATAIERVLTSQPQNSQNDDFLEDAVRARLTTFISSTTRTAPTSEQYREERALTNEADVVLARYRTFVANDIGPLNRELPRARIPLDLAAKPPSDRKPGVDDDERTGQRAE